MFKGRTVAILLGGVLSVLVFAAPRARAADGPIVAMFDMEDKGSGLSGEVLSNLVDYLAARMTECGYRIVPRDQIRKRIREQKVESYKECYDETCQVALGRELAAEKTMSTRVVRIADTCQVTGMLYDLKQATTDKAATVEAQCTERKLLEATKQLASKLCLVLNPQTAPAAVTEIEAQPEPPSPPMHPMTLWGHVSFWTGVGALGGGVAMMVLGQQAADDFDNKGDWSKQDESKQFVGLGIGGLGLGAALLTTGIVLWVLSPGSEALPGQEDEGEGSGPSLDTIGAMPMGQSDGWVFTLGGRW